MENNPTPVTGSIWSIIQAMIRCGLANNPTEAFKHQVRRYQQQFPRDSKEFESITEMLYPIDEDANFKIVQSTPVPAALSAEEMISKNDFELLVKTLVEMGYGDEIEWQRNLLPVWNAEDFYLETCWVILNSGMKEQVARIIWGRIQTAWHDGKLASSVFKHKGKCAALEYVRANKVKLFEDYFESADYKVLMLQRIPYIGKITCFHLAKNLGEDCVKPDRHLVRISSKYNTTPDVLCESISQKTGEKVSVVDIVLWRACNLGIL